jgi:hypothetical protein
VILAIAFLVYEIKSPATTISKLLAADAAVLLSVLNSYHDARNSFHDCFDTLE